MSRAFLVLAASVAAVWLCLVPWWSSGRAEAADEPLSAEAKAQINASLIVFAGEIAEIGPAPAKGGDAVQWVAYRASRVLKGSWSEERLVVEHVVREHPDPAGPGLDPKLFATGAKLILGVRVKLGAQPPNYTLRNTFGPSAVTDALLGDVMLCVTSESIARMQEEQRLMMCTNNLAMLTQVYLMQAQENRAKAQKYSGVALWLSYRKNATEIKRGDERVLLCPVDSAALPRKTEAEKKTFDDIDLSNPRAGLCSYAGRDFERCPLPFGEKPQPIGACLHHPGIVIVAFDDGSVRRMTLKDLGLASDADKIVGPDSKSPLLRVLR